MRAGRKSFEQRWKGLRALAELSLSLLRLPELKRWEEPASATQLGTHPVQMLLAAKPSGCNLSKT